MPLRPGEEAKLAPAEEQQLLEKLRREREAKAAAALQSAVQRLSATMVEMDLTDVHAEAKRLSKSDTVLASSPTDAQVALVLNAIMRSCCPPSSKDTPSKGKGGGKKQSNSVRAAAAKVTEGEPPQGTAVRKALKANAHLLAEVMKGKGEAGQFALLRAFQSWVLSPQGVNALEHAAKCIEILYDKDLAEEETLKSYWASLSAQRVGEDAELAASEVAATATAAAAEAAEAAVKVAEKQQEDAAWYLKQAEQLSQARRCGGNPNKDEEAAEKAAQINLRKCADYHKQMTKVRAARSKDLVEATAEGEPAKRLVEALRHRREVGVELFAKHAEPFIEWLNAEDNESGDD